METAGVILVAYIVAKVVKLTISTGVDQIVIKTVKKTAHWKTKTKKTKHAHTPHKRGFFIRRSTIY